MNEEYDDGELINEKFNGDLMEYFKHHLVFLCGLSNDEGCIWLNVSEISKEHLNGASVP
jgi:hypothetical protein